MATTTTEDYTDEDWQRINARGAESAARQKREREEAQKPPLYRTLAEAPGGTELHKVFRDGRFVGYEPVPQPPVQYTPSGFRNGAVG